MNQPRIKAPIAGNLQPETSVPERAVIPSGTSMAVGAQTASTPDAELPDLKLGRAAHTPGPWRAVNLQETIGGLTHKFAWAIEGAEGVVNHIARLAMIDAGPEVVAANARLIAVAPELLNLLKGVNDRFNEHFEITDQEEGGDFFHDEIRAAIAKAEGRES